MEKLKESPGLVALGVAAIATAGYLFMKQSGTKAVPAAESAHGDTESEAAHEETLPEVLENSFFLELSESAKKNEELIVKWMKEQCDVLLSANEDSKLAVVNKKLGKEDFLRTMMIIQNRMYVLTQEVNTACIAARSDLIKEKGIDSLDYIKRVIEDCQKLGNLSSDAISEVLALIKVGDWVIMDSQDEHIGSPDNVNTAYVRKFLELFLFYPYRALHNKTLEEAE